MNLKNLAKFTKASFSVLFGFIIPIALELSEVSRNIWRLEAPGSISSIDLTDCLKKSW
jgi:hypothetical protein